MPGEKPVGGENHIILVDKCEGCVYFLLPQVEKIYGTCELVAALGSTLSAARHPQDWCPDYEESDQNAD